MPAIHASETLALLSPHHKFQTLENLREKTTVIFSQIWSAAIKVFRIAAFDLNEIFYNSQNPTLSHESETSDRVASLEEVRDLRLKVERGWREATAMTRGMANNREFPRFGTFLTGPNGRTFQDNRIVRMNFPMPLKKNVQMSTQAPFPFPGTFSRQQRGAGGIR